MSLIPIRVYSRDSRVNISTHLCRLGAVLRISIVCGQCLLGPRVSPVSHAGSPPAAVPVVGPELLSEFVRRVLPFESLERIVLFAKSEDLRLPCCSQTLPHLWPLHCHYSDFPRFPAAAAASGLVSL